MTRKEVIDKAWNIMLTWVGNYTFDSYCEVVDMISDFNKEHPEDEILFCETDNGFSLDDYSIF